MEGLSKALGWDRDQQDMAFVAGVFSLLDVLLGMPMTEIVAALSLDLDVVMALLDRAGPLGELLAVVECHDSASLAQVGIDHETYWGRATAGLPLGDPGEQEYISHARASRLRLPEQQRGFMRRGCCACAERRWPRSWDASSAA